MVCFSAQKIKPRAKARATPRPFTLCSLLAQRGPETDHSRSALKIRRKKIEPLTNGARLRWQAESSLADPHARMVVAARGDALFGLADLGLGKCEACQRLAMHLSML